jgi:molybdopterin-binding protein
MAVDKERIGYRKGGTIMKVSARNVFKGKVKEITSGPVNAQVVVELPGGQQIVAIVTRSAVDDLGLAEGMQAYALIKASHVMLAVDH